MLASWREAGQLLHAEGAGQAPERGSAGEGKRHVHGAASSKSVNNYIHFRYESK